MKLQDNGQIKVGQHGMHTLLDTEGGREQTVKLQGNLRLVWPGKQCQESRQHQRLQYYEKKKKVYSICQPKENEELEICLSANQICNCTEILCLVT